MHVSKPPRISDALPMLVSLHELCHKVLFEVDWAKNNDHFDSSELEFIIKDINEAAYALQRLSVLIAVRPYDPNKDTFGNKVI